MGKGSVVLQLKSKRKPKAIFQPHGVVWAHTHIDRKNQNKGVRNQKSLEGIQDT